MSHSAQAPYPARAVAWYATVMLALLYWLSVLDRFIISLLVDPIKRDLGLTDVQFGLLQGFGFALTFALFGLVFGAIADRFSRRWVIFAGVSIWSVATAACGLAQSFWQLFWARIGVGAGEAALNPCATSMLTDLFPRDRLTSAMAVYAIGATIGTGTAFLFGGAIIDLVAHMHTVALPIIGDVRPWQAVLLMVGLPGVLIAATIFTVPEPERRGTLAASSNAGLWRTAYTNLLRFMKPRRRFFICHYAGFAFAGAVVAGGASWYPAHMGRTFGWGAGQIGLTLGLTLVIAGIAGKLLCGRVVDAMYRRGSRDAQLRWYAGCLIVATPIGVFATLSPNPWVFLGGLGAFLVLVSPMPVCANAALNLVTPNELRGTGVAFFTATAGIIGAGFGPVLIAAAAEHLFESDASIGFGIAVAIGICCPLASLLLALGLRAMRDAALSAERGDDLR